MPNIYGKSIFHFDSTGEETGWNRIIILTKEGKEIVFATTAKTSEQVAGSRTFRLFSRREPVIEGREGTISFEGKTVLFNGIRYETADGIMHFTEMHERWGKNKESEFKFFSPPPKKIWHRIFKK